MTTDWVIEFRNGSYFQSWEADHGGPRATAQRFPTREEADAYMGGERWALFAFAGGIAVPARKAAS